MNLSPACSERTAFLSEILDDMALGLLKIVLPKDYLYSGDMIDTEKNKEN